MKARLLAIALAPFVFAGCSAYCELADHSETSTVLVDDDVRPIASYVVCNHSYKLLGCIPLCSGVPWKSGPYADREEFNASFFSDHCTIDENLASVKAAMAECGSNRITGLVTTENSSWAWSLFLVEHAEFKTTCLICEPAKDGGKTASK